jgi:hypothetical protein
MGEDTDVRIDLIGVDGAVADVSAASEIKAVLVRLDESGTITPVYTLTSGYADSDWAHGKVVAPVLSADTSTAAYGFGVWQVQVVIGGKKRTFIGSDRVDLIPDWIP